MLPPSKVKAPKWELKEKTAEKLTITLPEAQQKILTKAVVRLRDMANHLYWRYLKYCPSYGKEDLLQDSIMYMLCSSDYPPAEVGAMTGWGYHVMRYRAMKAQDTHWRNGRSEYGYIVEERAWSLEDPAKVQLDAIALTAVTHLSRREQQVLWYRQNGYSHDDIAKALYTTKLTSRMATHKAYSVLRDALANQGAK